MRMTQKPYRFTALFFVAVFASTVLIAAAKPGVAYAATEYASLSLRKKAEVWVMGRALSKCINDKGFYTNGRSESDMADGNWLSNQVATVGEWSADITEGKSDDADTHCDDLAKKTLDLMGYDASDALCEMNDLAGSDAVWERDNGDCKSGTGDYDFNEGKHSKSDSEIWNRFFRKWLGDGIDSSLTSGMRYIIYTENFYQECSHDHGEDWGTPREWKDGDKEEDKVYKLNWNLNRDDGNDMGADKDWYIVSGGNGRHFSVNIDGYGMLTGDNRLECESLAERINGNASAYLTELHAQQDGDTNGGGGSTNGGGSTDPTCESVGGDLSWVLCPVLLAVDSTLNWLDSQVNNLLFIDDHIYSKDTLGEAWGTIRNIALLILVPMMMFMVIGTALSFGPFDPYTVKKALPRMFVAVIFIVLSLPVCQFAVQLSNVAGQGLGNIIIHAAPHPVNNLTDIFSDTSGGSESGLGLVALVAGIAGLALGGLGVLLSFGTVAIVGLMIGFIILIMRQVLLVSLIVLAPLAILTWIFPGNDKIWGIWKGTFIAMLLMYPIVSILLAAGKFVAGILG